ncbi:MAG: tol-pal system protein YbgF [Thermodesulfovibrionales bacterium]|nr:tol-pal system protein YbgF [Thermodesulfovibrionales bacterium]
MVRIKYFIKKTIRLMAAALFLCCTGLNTSCVTVTSDYDTLKSDVNMLKRDLYEMKVALADLKKNLDEIQTVVRAGGTEQTKALTESQIALLNKLNSLTAELAEIRARFEEQRHFSDKFLSESRQSNERLQARLEGLELITKDLQRKIDTLETQARSIKSEISPQPPSGTTIPKTEPERSQTSQTQLAAPPPQPAPPAETEKRGSDEPKILYDRARELFKDKKYAEARSLFEEFIKKYPDYRLAGNSRFWIAETYYAEKNYEDAILNYEKVIRDYPSNEKVPAAYLKQAYSFIELGDKKTAKVILERLIEKYPASEEAKAARDKLKELKGKPR